MEPKEGSTSQQDGGSNTDNALRRKHGEVGYQIPAFVGAKKAPPSSGGPKRRESMPLLSPVALQDASAPKAEVAYVKGICCARIAIE
jgi:hypothetical protein